MGEPIKIKTPITDDKVLEGLKAGDQVLISGTLYTGRDAAHKKLVELLDKGEPLPIDVKGQMIYYAGPTPTKPGKVIGSAGPTTSGRMDAYAPKLIAIGLKGMIGKGSRQKEVIDAMKKYKCVYLAAIGGAAALISQSIKSCKVVAYEELGPEAIRLIEVEDFPVVVVNDIYGNDLYEQGRKQYQR